MGHYTRVTQAIRRVERQPGWKINQLKRKLERLERGEQT
jgi:hypothetical protein